MSESLDVTALHAAALKRLTKQSNAILAPGKDAGQFVNDLFLALAKVREPNAAPWAYALIQNEAKVVRLSDNNGIDPTPFMRLVQWAVTGRSDSTLSPDVSIFLQRLRSKMVSHTHTDSSDFTPAGVDADDYDLAIIRFLNRTGTAQAHEDVAADVALDRKTVGKRLKKLRAAGLTLRGQRGERISDAGRAWLAKVGTQTPLKRPT